MNQSQRPRKWTVVELLKTTAELFQKRGISQPRLSAELLLGAVIGLKRVELYLNYDRPIGEEELARFRELVRRRLTHEPLQYILGETEFMSLKFRVTPDVLIPRPDTETLVEWALENLKERGPIRILDIGTGSGNIAVSLAHYLPEAQVVAVDSSEQAVRLALENARRYIPNGRIQIERADVLREDLSTRFGEPFDVIVSNPPYVTEEEFEQLPPEVARHEPEAALRENQPYAYYRRIAEMAWNLTREAGEIYVEVGAGHSADVRQIFSSAGYRHTEVRKDLAGIERVVRVVR